MHITRKDFLRWSTITGISTASDVMLTGCGGGGGGGGATPSQSIAVVTPPAPPSTPSAVNGAWSNPATWGGTVPSAASAVTISPGQVVILDTAAVCASLNIQGKLTADISKNISLDTGNIVVGTTGTLEIGTEANPFPSSRKATITLNGAEASRIGRVVGGTPLGFFNNGTGRSLIVQPGGVLSLIGQAPLVKRTKLNATVSSGASTFTLADNTGWKAGDEIAIGTTDFYGVQTSDNLILASDASGTTISTTRGISSARWGALQYVTDSGMSLTPGTLTNPPATAPTVLDERAFVINLTRNIVIQGANDAVWTGNGFGAYCKVLGINGSVRVDGVEFRRVSQAGVLERYPFEWHMASYNMPNGTNALSDGTYLGAANPANHYFKNNSVHASAQRGITVHGTCGLLIDSNVFFDIKGHAIFLEDGSEQDNVISNNTIIKVRAPTFANKLLNHDIPADVLSSEFFYVYGTSGSSGIWFSNPRNTLTGNWVNDAEGTGIWNTFAQQCFGLSPNVPIAPYTTALTTWDDNWAYGCKGVGVQTNRPVLNDKGDFADALTYQASFFFNPLRRVRTFKNGAGGYSNRVLHAKYQEFICADNMGMDVFGQAQDPSSMGENFLSVGESLNNTTSRAAISKRAAFATYHELLNFKNSIIVNFPFVAGGWPDTSFPEFGGGLFRMEDLYTQPVFTFSENTGNRLIGVPAPFRAKSPNIDGHPIQINGGATYRNWALAGAIKDVNGLFVPANNYWVPDHPFFTYSATGLNDVAPAGSNGKYTANRYFGVSNFIHTGDASRFTFPIEVTRQDSSGTAVPGAIWAIGDGTASPFLDIMRHYAVHNGGRYVYKVPGHVATTVSGFTITCMDNANDIFLMGVEFSGAVPAKVIQRALQWASISSGVPTDPSAGDISSGYGRILTSTTSLANVVSDITGTIFYQDTGANLVWFKVKVGSLALAGPVTIYRQVVVSVKAA